MLLKKRSVFKDSSIELRQTRGRNFTVHYVCVKAESRESSSMSLNVATKDSDKQFLSELSDCWPLIVLAPGPGSHSTDALHTCELVQAENALRSLHFILKYVERIEHDSSELLEARSKNPFCGFTTVQFSVTPISQATGCPSRFCTRTHRTTLISLLRTANRLAQVSRGR